MKKKWLLIPVAMVLALVLATPSYALVNWGENDLYRQLKSVFNKTTQNTATGTQVGGLTATGNVYTQTYLLSNGRYGSTVWTLASSSTGGAITSVPYAMILKGVGTTGGVDNTPGMTLPNGLAGQVLTIQITGLVASGTFIVTPTTKTGFNSITFDTRGDQATLLYDATLGWIILANGGAVINF